MRLCLFDQSTSLINWKPDQTVVLFKGQLPVLGRALADQIKRFDGETMTVEPVVIKGGAYRETWQQIGKLADPDHDKKEFTLPVTEAVSKSVEVGDLAQCFPGQGSLAI